MSTNLAMQPQIQSTAVSVPSRLSVHRSLPLAVLYAFVCLFFVVVWASGSKDSPLNLATAGVYLLIRLVGVGVGASKLRKAPFRRDAPAHWMLLAICLALLLDAIGAVVWLGYNLRGVLVPYPSLADIGYGGDTVLWTVGLFLLYAVLDTTPGEELTPFTSLLTASWSLTVVIIGLINGTGWVSVLPKVAMDIFYPFVWALNCAVAGSILFGPQHKRLRRDWGWFVILVYAGSLITFLTNLAYVVTAACPAGSPAAKYLYYNGGPLDFLFATGDFLMTLAIVVLPLHRPLLRDADADTSQTVQQLYPPASDRSAPSVCTDERPIGESGRLVEVLEDEIRFLRRELDAWDRYARRGERFVQE